MKKLILSVMVLLAVVFFSSQKVNAQTDPECYRVYQNEEYKCLQTRTKCTQSCSSPNSLKACADSCAAQDKACSNQASANLKACLAAIPKEGTKVSTEANAQPKNITCEEWKKIVGTEKCKYSVVTSTVIGDAINPRRDPSNSIWCSDTVDIGDTYINLPVDYKYATSDEQCIYNVNDNLYSGQGTNNAESTGFQQPTTTQTKELEEPAGKGIGEFIRKIQSLRLNSFDKSQDQVGDTDQKTPAKTIDDWIMENNLISDPARIEQMEREKLDLELYGRTPQMTEEIIKNAQSEWEAMFAKTNKESIVVVNGRGQFTTPEGFIVLAPQEKPVMMTYVDSTFINPNSETTQLNYTWGTSSGTVVSMPWQSEVKFLKPVQDEKTQELKRMLKLNKGEVEIKVKNDNKKDKFGVQGDFFDLFVIQTHFWVNQSQDKKMAVIGVYEGEVEVKTRDGKTIKIKPDGNKPGVVVISKKLSTVKLAFAGLVLGSVIGGVVFLLKKRVFSRSLSKKKR